MLGVYTVRKRGSSREERNSEEKKKIETKIFLVGMLSLYSVSIMVS